MPGHALLSSLISGFINCIRDALIPILLYISLNQHPIVFLVWMSTSQRKGKGKATGKRKRGDPSQSIIDLMHDSSWWEKNFTQQEKADQLLPANDSIKFANRYCELKYPAFADSRNLYLERTLKIPEALQ
ncbi:hypothetical protein HN51_001817 [Arachis hypogaea]